MTPSQGFSIGQGEWLPVRGMVFRKGFTVYIPMCYANTGPNSVSDYIKASCIISVFEFTPK